MARPGVLVDPPARESGYEGELTLSQVRSSRFLHVTGVDRRRQLFFLSRIPENAAAFLADDVWVELMATVDRGAHHLVLKQSEGILPAASGSTPPEPVILASRAIDNLPSLPPSALTPLSEDEALWSGGKERRAEAPAPEPPEPAPPTSLLRYLRRQLSEVRRENAALQARVQHLERRLASLDGAPLAMEADTADEVSEEA